jgi:hypothetical protein
MNHIISVEVVFEVFYTFVQGKKEMELRWTRYIPYTESL